MELLRKIIRNENDITPEEYHSFLASALEASASKCSLAAFLAALSAKPLNLQDVINIVGFIDKNSPRRYLSVSDRVVNIVGTGGGISTFNISTSAAFVAAAAGAMVLKSGSYAYNSKCGSLDVLSNLGIKLDSTVHGLEAMLEELNIGFVSPKMYSPLLRRIAVSIMPLNLREIGGFINTIGPLLCPFHVHGQICGVSSSNLIDLFATALRTLGIHNSIAVWSEIGLDEFSAIGINHLAFINKDKKIHKEEFNPLTYGMIHTDYSELRGGSASANATIMQSVLKTGKPLVARDTVALNAAFILILSGQSQSKEEALQLSLDAIASGAAYRLLQNTIDFSHDYAAKESR